MNENWQVSNKIAAKTMTLHQCLLWKIVMATDLGSQSLEAKKNYVKNHKLGIVYLFCICSVYGCITYSLFCNKRKTKILDYARVKKRFITP